MSVELKLTAGNKTEQRILDYLLANASEVLAEKINAGTKTLAGAMNYAKDEARTLASDGGCVCVDDATVFGWIVHYFEESSVVEEKPEEEKAPAVRLPGGMAKWNEKAIARAKKNRPSKSTAAKPSKKPVVAPAVPAPAPVKPDPQLSLFDALFAPEGKA